MGIKRLLNENFLPARVFWPALAIATASVFLLWGTGYPAEEWAAVSVMFYISVFAVTMGVALVTIFVGNSLASYGRRVVRQHGVDVDLANTPPSRIFRYSVAIVAVLAFEALVIGVALTMVTFAVTRMGMPVFSETVNLFALALLIGGAVGLLLLFGIPACIFFLADGKLKSVGVNLGRVYAATESLTRGRNWLSNPLDVPETLR